MIQPLFPLCVVDLTDESGEAAIGTLADLGAEVHRDAHIGGDTDVVVVTGCADAVACDALRTQYPHLIVAAITPFGLDGPRADWRGSDTVAQAAGGMLFVNGQPGEPPLRVLGTPTYHLAGLHAALGVVLALLARMRSGRGQLVDVSLQESAAAALDHVTGVFRDRGDVASRRGSRHWSGMFDVLQCADAPALVSQAGDWDALLAWLEADGAAGDLAAPSWRDSAARAEHADHVFAVLRSWAARYRAADLVEQAQLRRLPFALVSPLREVARHPQLEARGFLTGGRRVAGAACPNLSAEIVKSESTAAAEPVLRGIRVLDFTWVVAGPLATRVLADHGAEVIKVERVDAATDGRDGALFGNLNRGKRSIAVDLGTARGRDLIRDLVRQCDVVVDNFSPRVLGNFGLDHASLCALSPQLIAVSLSAFGASGPRADWVGYGPSLQAELGFTWHMRHAGGAPAGCGFALADTVSGYATALAIAAALLRRQRTGTGTALDLGALELAAAVVAPLLRQARAGADLPDAFGNADPGGDCAPQGVYRCRDDGGRERWCAIEVRGDDEWRRFVAALAAPSWTDDPRFVTHAGRCRHRSAIDAHVDAWSRDQHVADVVTLLQGAGIAASALADARDLAADAQLAARGYWVAVDGGPTLDGVVPRLAATPGRVRARGPALGADTDAVLRDLLGMEQSALARLRAEGIIR